jgi:23S rRNA pseudouridine1911/1915/1917 synthase
MTISYPPLEFVFEDDALVALVKPPGLPTANAEAGQESVYTLLKRRWPPGAFIGVVSRLDAPVSGVVVIAKTSAAAASLAAQFRDRSVKKTYQSVVEGRFPAPLDTWVEWHDLISREPGQARSTVHRPPASAAGKAATNAGEADSIAETAPKPAHVRARVLCRAGEASLVELCPLTGRRHQLRVQLASRGCPIVGDRLYGARLPFPAGIALHAAAIAIDHPTTGALMQFDAPLPREWTQRFPSLFRRQAGGR